MIFAQLACTRVFSRALSRSVMQDLATTTSRAVTAGSQQEISRRDDGSREPPRRKHRTEISILKALSSCVGHDPTGHAYIYVDDPFLLPDTTNTNREFAIARASGVLAARYMLRDMPNIFARFDFDEPRVELLAPQLLPASVLEEVESGTVTPDDGLDVLVDMGLAEDAWAIYEKHQESLSVKSQLRLFDLLCVTNCMNPPEEMPPSEAKISIKLLEPFNKPEKKKFYSEVEEGEDEDNPVDNRPKVWTRDNLAELTFLQLPEKPPSAYRSLVRGAAKWTDAKRAFEIGAEMKEQGIPKDVATYNALIRCSYLLPKEADPWQVTTDLLHEMQEAGVQPDLYTFENILFTLVKMPIVYEKVAVALRILKEMMHLGIEPSLGCYAHFLRMISNDWKDIDSGCHCLSDVLGRLEKTSHEWEEPVSTDDFLFFSEAMQFATSKAKSVLLANRLDKLLNSGGFAHLIGPSSQGYTYYSNLITVLSYKETVERLMEVYTSRVPSRFIPSRAIFEKLLHRIRREGAWEHLPKMFEDLVAFRYFFRDKNNLLSNILVMMADVDCEDELKRDLASSMSFLWSEVSFAETHSLRDNWKQIMKFKELGAAIQICVNGGDLESAWDWFQFSGRNSLWPVREIVFMSRAFLDEGDVEKSVTAFVSLRSTLEEVRGIRSESRSQAIKLADEILTVYQKQLNDKQIRGVEAVKHAAANSHRSSLKRNEESERDKASSSSSSDSDSD